MKTYWQKKNLGKGSVLLSRRGSGVCVTLRRREMQIGNGARTIRGILEITDWSIKEEIAVSARKYHLKARRATSEYVGACVCPRCGKRGCKHYLIRKNILTDHVFISTFVVHTHWENGKTQYAGTCYVGDGPVNDSSVSDNGALMSPKSQYPSAVEFNITRLPGIQIESCDAIIEFYSIQIATDTGVLEKNCYFIGTNYNPSFSKAQLTILFEHVYDVVSPKELTSPIRGNFEFNMTDNTFILSTAVGSPGVYTTGSSSLGLWRTGEPNVVSVTVQRIGYLTISNDSVSLYKDPSNRAPTATAQLNAYGNGFLHNNLLPPDKLSQTDLFHPSLSR